jgi:hypothetical protein
MLNGKVAGIFKTGMRLNDEAPMAMSDVRIPNPRQIVQILFSSSTLENQLVR